MTKTFTKTIFGYPINILNKGNFYIVKVESLDIEAKSESKGRAIRDVFKSVKEYFNEKQITPEPASKDDEYHHKVQIRMFKLNQKITNFGFSIIADDITTPDMAKLENICNSIDTNKNYSQDEKRKFENKLVEEVFCKYIFNPDLRALTMNALIMKSKHIKKFSHLIEQAFFSLFRGEFISTVMILTPVIEGILLSLYGFDPKLDNKPKEYQLLNKWAEIEYDFTIPQLPHPFMIDEYIRAFIDIWEQTIFSRHQFSEENLFFNRHYITHQMGEKEFYSRNNAYKLVMMIDLLAHVMAACHGQHGRFSFDTNNKSYLRRKKCYESFALNLKNHQIYHQIMEEHQNYILK